MLTCVMFKYLSAISPIRTEAPEQAVPRIISFVGCDGSVCWIRRYTAGIDEHCTNIQWYVINETQHKLIVVYPIYDTLPALCQITHILQTMHDLSLTNSALT